MKFRDKSTGGGKNFLKLKAGESVRGVFRGDPYEFRQHWTANRGVKCEGASCELCKSGDKSSFRFRLNLVIQENGALAAKVFEQGWTVYELLKALHEGDYDLEKHFMKITRHGTGTDTSYSIVPVPNGAVSKDTDKQIAAVKLADLSHQAAEEAEEEAS